jgi:Raf kinase inhibitor-like YbhB/YbcL family protein
MRTLYLILFCFLFLLEEKTMALTLTSPAFTQGGDIPQECTCDGPETFPGLEWSSAPEGTQSFALICSDPDVPETLRSHVPDLIFNHLILFNIPASIQALPRGPFKCPTGAICAKNSSGDTNYIGPCPPDPKHHRYFFDLYALNSRLELDTSVGRKELLQKMEGHILAKTTLIGRYLKQKFK